MKNDQNPSLLKAVNVVLHVAARLVLASLQISAVLCEQSICLCVCVCDSLTVIECAVCSSRSSR